VVAGGALLGALLLAGGGRAQPRSAPECSAADYIPVETVPWRLTRAGAVVPAAAIITEDLPRRCMLDIKVRIGLRSQGHRMAAIGGNPATGHIAKVLHPWSQVVYAWAWRNWCGARRHAARALIRVPGLRTVPSRVFKLPRCRRLYRRSRLLGLGVARSSRMLPRDPGLVFPAQLNPEIPPIPSPALIRIYNRWIVGDGRSITDVYAGETGDGSGGGIFVIYKTLDPFGYQNWHSVFVPGQTGGVKIVKAPFGKKVETSAQRAKLEFVSKQGVRGILDLDGDTVSLQGP
jgi:hypothetical protein